MIKAIYNDSFFSLIYDTLSSMWSRKFDTGGNRARTSYA
jgi:hypothetical protein